MRVRSICGLVLIFACSSQGQFESDDEPKSDSTIRATDLWPGGDVYLLLEFDEEIADHVAAKEELLQASQDLAANTGIRLQFITDKSQAPGDHWATFGYLPGGGGEAFIGAKHHGEALSSAEAVTHELGHILGLEHTQSRVDRDDNITVHPSWRSFDTERQYRLATNDYIVGPYDVDSVMHYTSYNSRSNTCGTISRGMNNADECITEEDQRFIKERNRQYTDWNYSVLAALYCDDRYCGDRCADASRCAAEQVQLNLKRLHDWEASPEGLALAERYPRNTVGSEIACELYPARPSEPAVQPFVGSCDGYNEDEDSDDHRAFGGVEEAYPVWFKYRGSDYCEVDPSVRILGDVGVCMYVECVTGSAVFSCPPATEKSSTIQEGKELAGCCGETDFTIEPLRCEGSRRKSAFVYLEVQAKERAEGEGDACHGFRVDYHF